MNKLFSLFALLILGPCLVIAQRRDCSAVTLRVTSSSPGVTSAWRIYVQNKTSRNLLVRASALDFHWKMEEASTQGWQEILTGGVGPGKPSHGASPGVDADTRTIAKHQKSLIFDFDAKRDLTSDGTIKRGKRYRISFAQDVTLLGGIRETVCKLVAKPQSFQIGSTSKEHDSGSGLADFHLLYYSSAKGRFVSGVWPGC